MSRQSVVLALPQDVPCALVLEHACDLKKQASQRIYEKHKPYCACSCQGCTWSWQSQGATSKQLEYLYTGVSLFLNTLKIRLELSGYIMTAKYVATVATFIQGGTQTSHCLRVVQRGGWGGVLTMVIYSKTGSQGWSNSLKNNHGVSCCQLSQ